MIEIGSPLPAFTLPDHAGTPTDSSILTGGWFLLFWYPRADTPGCTAQAEGLRDQIETFEELGCDVLGASFDPPDANSAFRARYRLPFRLLTDPDHSAALAQGAVADLAASTPQRIAYLVRPGGTVERSYEVDDPEFFAEVVLDDLEDALAAQG